MGFAGFEGAEGSVWGQEGPKIEPCMSARQFVRSRIKGDDLVAMFVVPAWRFSAIAIFGFVAPFPRLNFLMVCIYSDSFDFLTAIKPQIADGTVQLFGAV